MVSSRGNNHKECRALIGEMYQIHINIITFYTHEVLTLHEDGTVDIIDSTQNGVDPTGKVVYPPFTHLIGVWRCVGKNKVELRFGAYNLKVPDSKAPGSLGINFMGLTFTDDGEKLTGTTKYSNYELGINPTKPGAKPLPGETYGPYTISGDRLDFYKQ
ncbi:unnamed protein product [Rotaria sp. Silwood2]|nr:unnamed protein product [Rotaria sp. Silwood2]CAF3093014.1 unnamed protein product [Rotaria sp. Silwood2]CAF4430788.1 unnamed protein product [Rotaria sp. Silwood2]CAF4470896.1 unnamed protein product [Rotaria sp. Silwood2]